MVGQQRVTKLALEARWEADVPDNHPIMPWMADYSAVLVNRFEVGRDGRTAYERLKGKRARMKGLEFGERLQFKAQVWRWCEENAEVGGEMGSGRVLGHHCE